MSSSRGNSPGAPTSAVSEVDAAPDRARPAVGCRAADHLGRQRQHGGPPHRQVAGGGRLQLGERGVDLAPREEEEAAARPAEGARHARAHSRDESAQGFREERGRLNLSWLVQLHWWAILGQLLIVGSAELWTSVGLPVDVLVVVVALAALNAFGGFCVGCAMYYWLGILKVPGFTKTPPGGITPGMKPKAS